MSGIPAFTGWQGCQSSLHIQGSQLEQCGNQSGILPFIIFLYFTATMK